MSRTKPAVVAALGVALVTPGASAAPGEPPPQTSGTAALVMDARTGAVMHGVRPRRPRPVASATKLMTALLTLERAELGSVLPAADYRAGAIESKIDLSPGERMRVRDLLTALLLESANDAAVTLAVGVAGTREAFVREMNRRAVTLGLRETSYANPIGFDAPDNHSSAFDLARLARRLLRNRAFARIVDLPRATLRSGRRVRVIDNRNRLVQRYPFVSGVKTGHTSGADYVLVGSGEARGARVITVTLGAPSEAARDADTLALLRWGLEQFRRVRVVKRGEPLARVDVRWRDERAEVGAARAARVLLRRGERAGTVVKAPEELEGPLPAGHRVGWVEVTRGGRTLRRVPLVTLRPVEGASVLRRVTTGADGILTVVLLLGIVTAAMLAAGRWRRAR